MSQTHRPAAAALFAAALAYSHLVLAQETVPPSGGDPIASERPVTLPPVTSPVVTTPATQPTASPTTAPPPLPKASVEPTTSRDSAELAATRQATRRAATRARAEPAPARSATASVPAEPAPEAALAAAAAPAPAAEAAAPPAAALPAPPPAETAGGASLAWLIGAGALALLFAFAAVALLRRRRARGEADEEAFEAPKLTAAAAAEPESVVEPVPASAFAPAAAIPLADQSESVPEPAIEPARVSLAEADPADVEALVASSEPPPGRPWLEFFLRPIRAGTDADSATVEFALTVGNTGSEPARDVRVSAFMFSAGSAAESEMERMLIEPSRAQAAELALDSGDAARVEGAARLPTKASDGEVLPVVVADARYRLPDGSEGVMRAAFEIGRAEGDSPAPFRLDRPDGMTDELATRLHGEVERA